ncbi:MAG: DUF2259 domain-containing protein [Bauldia sp.]|nr:DUF2259 domain-containing protein [Bauldia sp.]
MATLAIPLALLPRTATAGDYADRAILGFSPDGSTFAFEEFGVQDGSGYAYSTIHVIDVDTNAPLPGTPIRVMHDDEDIPLATVRREAVEAAAPILEGRGVDLPGRVVVSNPASEVSTEPYQVRFLTDLYANWGTHVWTLTLTPAAVEEKEACLNLGPIRGVRLDLANPLGELTTLLDEKTLPDSRGCAQDYAIADVITFFPDGPGADSMIVLLHVITQGFEGPDRRFLPIATRFEDR